MPTAEQPAPPDDRPEYTAARPAATGANLMVVDDEPTVRELLCAALQTANERIEAAIADDAERTGMGTTVTAVLLAGDRIATLNVGDSRLYLSREGVLTQLTRDDTYVQALVEYTRQSGRFPAGLSPRAALALLRSAQAWALIAGREHVLPEDVQAVLPGVAGHRLAASAEDDERFGKDPAAELLAAVPIP